jgi:hypothetical protein
MTISEFRPTHVAPQTGLQAWEAPDVSRPTAPLDPLLPVQLVERRGDWGQIVCANGWSAWVDGRLLVAVPQDPPAAGQPLARTADPRPLLARVEESLARYRTAAEDRASGRTDGEGFRRRTQGLRVGMVVDGESVWLYDAEHERWVYCDGIRLSTLAAASAPSASVAPKAAPAPPAPLVGEDEYADETRPLDQAQVARYEARSQGRGPDAGSEPAKTDAEAVSEADEPTRVVERADSAPQPHPHPPTRPGGA